MQQEKTFPNGFQSWIKTHYEVVQYINSQEEGFVTLGTKIERIKEERGLDALYTLAEQWTDDFEAEYVGKTWESGEFFDTIDNFLTTKNYES
jgi:hypothetical protein